MHKNAQPEGCTFLCIRFRETPRVVGGGVRPLQTFLRILRGQAPSNSPFPSHPGCATTATATATATTAMEEFSQSIQAPSSTHPGISYPVKANPSLRYIRNMNGTYEEYMYIYIYVPNIDPQIRASPHWATKDSTGLHRESIRNSYRGYYIISTTTLLPQNLCNTIFSFRIIFFRPKT